MIDVHEIADRRASLEDALGSQWLEGLDIDSQTLLSLERVVRGEIEFGEVIKQLDHRVAAGEFRDVPTNKAVRKIA